MNKLKNSLKGKVLLLAVMPLLGLAFILGAVTAKSITITMEKQVEDEMKDQCAFLMDTYERLYPGKFSVELINNNTAVKVFKGGYEITGEHDTLNAMKKAYGEEFTIFCRGLSVLTTLEDANGELALLNEIPSVVQKEVLEQNQTRFYTKVDILGENYYAYFEPIVWPDGTVFGMVGVYRSSAVVSADVKKAILPIILVFIVSSIVIAIICVLFAEKLVTRIIDIEHFISSLAKGNFDNDLPQRYVLAQDELGSLAQSGKIMQRSLRQLVEFDALTNLNNRRYGDTRLKKIHENSIENGTQYCVAIGDIDFFKKVNDTYGHDAGDAVLKAVASVLKRGMAGKGFVARWGGEEFLFVFEMAKLEFAEQTLWDILSEVRNMEVDCGDNTLKVTMSFGVTESSDEVDVDEILKTADERLYTAKETGRNQVVAS